MTLGNTINVFKVQPRFQRKKNAPEKFENTKVIKEEFPSVRFWPDKQHIVMYGNSKEDHIWKKIESYRHFYYRKFLRYFKFVVRHKGALIDVGAKIGNHSISYSKKMKLEVFAFELYPVAYYLLSVHIRENPVNVMSSNIGIGVVKP